MTISHFNESHKKRQVLFTSKLNWYISFASLGKLLNRFVIGLEFVFGMAQTQQTDLTVFAFGFSRCYQYKLETNLAHFQSTVQVFE